MGERERELLLGIRRRASGTAAKRRGGVRVGIGDDAAVLALRPGEELVVTTDLSIEDVHFRRHWHAPEAVGHKCLARGLSDVAAMGARPIAAFLSLAVPREFTRVPEVSRGARGSWTGASWVDRFYNGLLALANRHGVPLAGGDLAQSPGEGEGGDRAAKAMADIVVVGAVARGRALLRSGARPGDLLYVTGSLGGAAAELRALEQAPQRFRDVTGKAARNVTDADTNHPHFFPEPRLGAGQALVRRRLATAAIDISDGFSVDLAHLCEESHVRAEVDVAALPLGGNATLEDALHGGDDYELLFTASSTTRMPRRIGGVAVTRIGRVLAKRRGRAPIELVDGGVRTPLVPRGWQHF